MLHAAHSINDNHVDKEWQREDETSQQFEQLLRKLLVNDQGKGAEDDPAVVYVHSWKPCPNGYGPRPGVSQFFASKTEQEYDVLLQYYSLPWVSLRNAVYHAAQRNVTGLTKEDIFVLEPHGPCTHPNTVGHKYIADLLVYLIQQTIVQLAETGFSEADAVEAMLPLPPIMMPYNKDFTNLLCLNWEELNNTQYVDRVASSKTWDYTCDVPKKCGWITYTAGDRLVLRVNTALPKPKLAGAAAKDTSVSVHLGLLASYEHMGMVEVTCVGGCSCGRNTVNTHNPNDRTSQIVFLSLPVTQHPDCRVQLLCLKTTTSGEHKLKLANIVVTAGAGNVGKKSIGRPDRTDNVIH